MNFPHLGRLVLPLALAAAAAGCASETTTTAVASTNGRQCFFLRDINNFQAVNDTTVNLRVGVSDIYRVTLFAPCPDARFTEGMAVRTTGGDSTICNPLDAELIVPTGIGPQRCPLSDIRKLSPQEVAALAPRERP